LDAHEKLPLSKTWWAHGSRVTGEAPAFFQLGKGTAAPASCARFASGLAGFDAHKRVQKGHPTSHSIYLYIYIDRYVYAKKNI